MKMTSITGSLNRPPNFTWCELPPERDTYTFFGKVPPNEIGLLNALVDAYEGLALMRTDDPEQGAIEFWVPPQRVAEFLLVIKDIQPLINVVLDAE